MSIYRHSLTVAVFLLLLQSGTACVSNKELITTDLQRTFSLSEPRTILFVGNSYFYYNDSLHNHVRRLVEDLNPELKGRLQYKSATIGGAHLGHHNIDSHLEPGKLGIESRFEWVILQGGSSDALSKERHKLFMKNTSEFSEKIANAGAKTALYMIHAYVPPHAKHDSMMIRKVEEMYVDAGNNINAPVIPVGLAFERAYTERPDIKLHKEFDGSHPSLLGTYLAACVVYASLYKKSPVGSNYTYFGQISIDDARFLQQVALDTVETFTRSKISVYSDFSQ